MEELKKLRYILLGGGPTPEMLLDTCIHEKLPIVKVYGMTETCSGTFGLKLLEEPQSKFYAGRPFPGVKVWIKDDEIHVSGPVVMKGYLNEQETKGTHNSQKVLTIGKRYSQWPFGHCEYLLEIVSTFWRDPK